MTTPRTPVVFIHGLWLHATSWTPWLELFGHAGYEPVAPGWPNEPDTSSKPGSSLTGGHSMNRPGFCRGSIGRTIGSWQEGLRTRRR